MRAVMIISEEDHQWEVPPSRLLVTGGIQSVQQQIPAGGCDCYIVAAEFGWLQVPAGLARIRRIPCTIRTLHYSNHCLLQLQDCCLMAFYLISALTADSHIS